MAEEDWYRAITELKRHRFYAGDAERPRVNGLIGMCYLRGRQHFDAYKAFGRVLDDPAASDAERSHAAWRRVQAAHLGGASLLVLKDAPALTARAELGAAAGPIGYLQGHNLLLLGRWADAREVFNAVDGPLGGDAARIAAALEGAPRLSPKSPALAGFLALVPGLGHVYAERYDDALNAFYPNAALMAATGVAASFAHQGDISYAWPALVGSVALAFYGANIYSAVNVTRQANQLIIANEAEEYRDGSELPRLESLDYAP